MIGDDTMAAYCTLSQDHRRSLGTEHYILQRTRNDDVFSLVDICCVTAIITLSIDTFLWLICSNCSGHTIVQPIHVEPDSKI